MNGVSNYAKPNGIIYNRFIYVSYLLFRRMLNRRWRMRVPRKKAVASPSNNRFMYISWDEGGNYISRRGLRSLGKINCGEKETEVRICNNLIYSAKDLYNNLQKKLKECYSGEKLHFINYGWYTTTNINYRFYGIFVILLI